jgi:predicted permease
MIDGVLVRVLEVIIPVFSVVFVGLVYGRYSDADLSGFNKISIDVLTPMLVYTALASKNSNLHEIMPLLYAVFILICACGLVAWLLARLTKIDPRSLVPVVMFNNCGNMGLPLALLAFGETGFNAAVALFALNNLVQFSLGTRIMSSGSQIRDLVRSPVMIASVLGFLSFSIDFRPPELIFSTMKMMGEASLPLMLFALGMRLNSLKTSDLLDGLVGALARPIIGIGLAWLITALFSFEGTSKGLLILFGALPPPVIQYMLAERYRQEPQLVAAMVMAGNAFAIVFVPLALYFVM